MKSRGSISNSSNEHPEKLSEEGLADRAVSGSGDTIPAEGSWLPIGTAFLLPFALASFFPTGPVWGFNTLAVFSPWIRIAILLVSLGLLLMPAGPLVVKMSRSTVPASTMVLALTGLSAMAFFRGFPIATDMFGDHRNMLTWHGDNTRFDPAWWGSVLSPELYATKEALTIAVARSIAFLFRLSIGGAYAWLAVVSGGCVVAAWVLLVSRYIPDVRTAAPLLICGLFTGGHLIFFGHVENYPFAAALAFFYMTVSFVGFIRPVPLWIITVLFLLAFRAHALNGLLAGGLGVTFLHAAARNHPGWARLLTWRAMFLLVIPVLALAACAGVIIVRRDHPEIDLFELILPIRQSPPPHGNYLLQSPEHFLDFVNLLALVALPALALVAGLLIRHRRQIDTAHPQLLWAAMSLAIPAPFFFALNTKLGPERDWDIFALMTPPILFLALTLAARARSPLRLPGSALGVVLALSLFSISGAVVNSVPELVSLRLQGMGEWAYRSYFTGSAYLTVAAIRMEPDRALRRTRLERVAERMKPRIRDYDTEYAHLLAVLASEYAFSGEIDKASSALEQSLKACPRCGTNRASLADLYMDFGDFEAARPHVEEMLRQSPESPDAIRRVLALEAHSGPRSDPARTP